VIVELIVNMFVGLVGLVVGATGTAEPPGFIQSIGPQLQELVNLGASLGAWVPWSIVGSAVGAVGGAYVISLLVKLVRIVVSLFSGGGGSAA